MDLKEKSDRKVIAVQRGILVKSYTIGKKTEGAQNNMGVEEG